MEKTEAHLVNVLLFLRNNNRLPLNLENDNNSFNKRTLDFSKCEKYSFHWLSTVSTVDCRMFTFINRIFIDLSAKFHIQNNAILFLLHPLRSWAYVLKSQIYHNIFVFVRRIYTARTHRIVFFSVMQFMLQSHAHIECADSEPLKNCIYVLTLRLMRI